MITRAQAEALLTLAESLEACERLQIEVGECSDGKLSLRLGESYWFPQEYEPMNSMSIRLAVNALIPKQES